jgi:hypothetical protein
MLGREIEALLLLRLSVLRLDGRAEMLFDRPRPLREEVEEEEVVEGYSEMRAMTEGSKTGRLLTDWERFSLVAFFDDDDDDDGRAH